MMRNFVRSIWLNVNLLEKSEVLVYVLVLSIFTLMLVIFAQSKKNRLFEGGSFYGSQLIEGEPMKKYQDQEELMDGLRGLGAMSEGGEESGIKTGVKKEKEREGLLGYGVGVAKKEANNTGSSGVGERVGEKEVKKEEVKEEEWGSKWLTYTVKRGDFLVKIGNRFEVDLRVILKHNKIRDPNLIYLGQKIRIPVSWGDGDKIKRDKIKKERNIR